MNGGNNSVLIWLLEELEGLVKDKVIKAVKVQCQQTKVEWVCLVIIGSSLEPTWHLEEQEDSVKEWVTKVVIDDQVLE